ncbi:MAG TPA: hypothetical protein VIA63_09190 [Candidatus Limnocylindria bacterium]|jgi:hypothetical protein
MSIAMTSRVILKAGAMAAALIVGLPSAAAAASPTTTCDGPLAAGTYLKVVVPADAFCFSEGSVTIRGGVNIGPGATLVLGSEDSPGNTATISGGVRATNARSVQIHFATIQGKVDIQGGSGPFGGPFDVTWNTIEDSQINGAVTIEGYDGFWQGFIRNHVNGAVRLNDNVLADPDGNEYVTNTINGSLSCFGNDPAPQIGDSEGSPNQVHGAVRGQCAEID